MKAILSILALSLTFSYGQATQPDTQASGDSTLQNPDPGPCCNCITMTVNGIVDQPGANLKKLEPNGKQEFEAKVVIKHVGTNTTEPPCADSYNITVKSFLRRNSGDEFKGEQFVTVTKGGAAQQVNFTLPAADVRQGDQWFFKTSCGGSGGEGAEAESTGVSEPLPYCPTLVLNLGGCEACKASGSCQDTATPEAENHKGFGVNIPTSPSYGGMTKGNLNFYTQDFTNPGPVALLENFPSNFTTTRNGSGILTSVATGSSTLEIAAATALLAQDPNAFTITHKDPSGTAFRTTTIAKITEAGIPRLRMDTVFEGATTRHEQTQPSPGTLVLEKGRVVPIGSTTEFQSLRQETLVKTETTPGIRVHRRTIKERPTSAASWQTVSEVESTWEKLSEGWVQTKEIIDPISASLTTTWTYYLPGDITGPGGSTTGIGRLKQMTRYDGYVSFHTYTLNESTTTTPYAANPAGKVTTTTWNPVTQTETTTTTINGTLVAKAETAHTATTETNKVYTSGSNFLTTTTHYVPSGIDFGGKPLRTIHPDGTLTTYSYTRLTTSGAIVSTIASDGTVTNYGSGGQPLGGYTTIIENGSASGNTVAQGTRTTTTTNSRGTTILSKTEAIGYSTGSTLFSSMAVTEVDNLGRALTTAHHPTTLVAAGEQATASGAAYTTLTNYSCCGIAKETDMYGIPTFYAYDYLQRQIKTNRLGVTMETVRKGLTTETHRYAETVEESLTPTFAGTGNNLIGRSVSNLSGTLQESWSPDPTPDPRPFPLTDPPRELIKSTSTATSFQPATGLSTRSITTTVDSYTQTTDSYLDGSTYKTTGVLAPEMEYHYSVTTIGQLRAQAYLDGTTHREITASQSDWAGRTIKSGFLSSLTSDVLQSYVSNEYNSSGQMVKSTDPDGVITLMAYNALGEQTITAIDLNRNNQIDYGSDTVTGSEQNFLSAYAYTSSDTLPAIHSISKVWKPGAAEGSPTVTGHSYRAPNGLYAAATQLGVANPSLQKIALSGSGNWTTTSTAPDGTKQRQTYTAGRITLAEQLTSDSTPVAITSTTFAYDTLNRQQSTTDSRTGTTTTTYLSATADVVSSVTDPGSRTTAFTYDIRGRQIKVDAPNTTVVAQNGTTQTGQNETFTSYYPDGNTRAQWGDQINPSYHEYDYADRLVKLHTWQSAVTLTSSTTTPPSGSAVTTWLYDSARGWLNEKNYDGETDDGTTDADYTYTAAGRLLTRTWERGVITTYDYDNGGRQTHITYTNETNGHTTPSLVMEYDCLNRIESVTRGGVLHAEYDYDSDYLTLIGETQQLDSLNQTITRNYDNLLRPTGIGHAHSPATYSYDSSGRLSSVADATNTFTYGYQYSLVSGRHKGVTSSGTQSILPFTLIGPAVTTSLEYDTTRNALLKRSNETISTYAYAVNPIGQRTELEKSGTALPNGTSTLGWSYNSRGEVVQADDSSTANDDRAYQYDYIGNRKKSVNGLIAALPTSDNYSANSLNQYTDIDTFTPSYDLDGNQIDAQIKPLASSSLTSGVFLWDAENRLVKCTTSSTTVDYQYDHQSRLIARSEGGTTVRYLYDGWNRIAEYEQTTTGHQIKTCYLWGMDMSGSMQGAGGVSGLLAVTEMPGSSSPITYYPLYDGNGNVTEYIDNSATVVAHYEYDPFGNTTVATGAKANDFVYRFSTKPIDAATGLYYYGYRYYDPVTGRWPSRDPIEERGGVNLYGFVGNDSSNNIDLYGLWIHNKNWSGQRGNYAGTCCGEENDTLANLAQKITGHAEDSALLAVKEVVIGVDVDISPLLKKLEERLRTAVVSNTSKFHTQGLFQNYPDKDLPDRVDDYFKPNCNHPSECSKAVKAIQLRSLKDVLPGVSFSQVAQKDVKIPKDALNGDWTYLQGYITDTKSIWIGENIIKVDNDKWWGWVGSGQSKILSVDQWIMALKKAGKPEEDWDNEPEGFKPNFVYFYDVPKIAEEHFNKK